MKDMYNSRAIKYDSKDFGKYPNMVGSWGRDNYNAEQIARETQMVERFTMLDTRHLLNSAVWDDYIDEYTEMSDKFDDLGHALESSYNIDFQNKVLEDFENEHGEITDSEWEWIKEHYNF